MAYLKSCSRKGKESHKQRIKKKNEEDKRVTKKNACSYTDTLNELTKIDELI